MERLAPAASSACGHAADADVNAAQNILGAVADHASIQAGAYPEVVGRRKKR